MSGATLPGIAEAVEDDPANRDDWWTPPAIFAPLGPFDLDPCAPLSRPEWTGCARQLTIADDGLSSPWAGRVWLNPPYSNAGAWVRKLADHGDGIALVFARTETGWWQEEVWPRADGFLFLAGRVSFRPGGAARKGSAPTSPSVLIAFGQRNVDALLASGLAGAHVGPALRASASMDLLRRGTG